MAQIALAYFKVDFWRENSKNPKNILKIFVLNFRAKNGIILLQLQMLFFGAKIQTSGKFEFSRQIFLPIFMLIFKMFEFSRQKWPKVPLAYFKVDFWRENSNIIISAKMRLFE